LGRVLLIGTKDKTKEIAGVLDSLQEEERIANVINNCVASLIISEILNMIESGGIQRVATRKRILLSYLL
jgi:hypothetical protein